MSFFDGLFTTLQALDVSENESARALFAYEEAPSASLAVAILDLYDKFAPGRCGEVCLALCNDLSARLAAYPERYDHYVAIASMRRLLFNAKLKFLDSGRTQRVELCDTYLALVELLQMLLTSRVDRLLAMTDLIQPHKARRLRDWLIEEDKFSLAMQVATKCRLDSFDVWSAWGMSLLRLGE